MPHNRCMNSTSHATYLDQEVDFLNLYPNIGVISNFSGTAIQDIEMLGVKSLDCTALASLLPLPCSYRQTVSRYAVEPSF